VKVSIKNFGVDMEVKNNGIELDISSTDGKHIGDLFVTKAKLIWCKGRTDRKNGKATTWDEFMAHMEKL
jgi:hypothetical protein